MLETWHISRHPYVVSENIPFLLMSASCCKRLAFFVQKSTFTQQCESCVTEFLIIFTVFVRQKVTITKNITFADPMSRIRHSDCSKLAKNLKNDNDATIFRHYGNVNFFRRRFFSVVKFSSWSRFHVNIITASEIMAVLFYKGLTRNPEIGNNPVCVFPNIQRMGRVMDTNFDTNISNRMLLNAAKLQGYRVMKGKPTGGLKSPPPTTHIRVNSNKQLWRPILNHLLLYVLTLIITG